jgi:hypothetical protein
MGTGFEALSRAMALILVDIYLHHYSCLLHIWIDLLAEIRAFVSWKFSFWRFAGLPYERPRVAWQT